MTLIFNSNIPETITYNGNDVLELYYNNVLIWAKSGRLPLFTTIKTAKELTNEELTQYGLAKFGTYVTDSDFYNACLDLYNNGTDYTWEAPYWVQPTMTADTTTTTEGKYAISTVGNSTSNPAYYAMDNDTNTYINYSSSSSIQQSQGSLKVYIIYSLPVRICVDTISFSWNNNSSPQQFCFNCLRARDIKTTTIIGTNGAIKNRNAQTISANNPIFTKSIEFDMRTPNMKTTYNPRLTQVSITPYVNKIVGKKYSDLIFYDVSANVTFNDISNTSVTQTNLESVQDFETRWGESNFYGIDTVNQRILLPNKLEPKYLYIKGILETGE